MRANDKVRFKSSFLLMNYLKSHLSLMLVMLVFIITFLVVSLLYHLPLEPVVYSFVLSGTLALILTLHGFINFHIKHKRLNQLMIEDNILPENLPHISNLIEEDYNDIIQRQYVKNMALLSEADAKRSEIMDYYTMWAHQIKVPISAIGLLLQTDYQVEYSETVKQELFKIEQYVEMVLYYLRIDNISSDLLLKEHDLYDLVKQAIRKYSVLFIYKKITLQLEEFDCSVLTDEKWLVFVLEQVLSNAIKYTKVGSVSIYMDHKRPKTLVIEDSGIGIQEEDIPRIFDKGFTGYNGRMDKKSTGIGLYLTLQILGKLSHTISVTSKVGQGTKVFIGLDSDKIEIE